MDYTTSLFSEVANITLDENLLHTLVTIYWPTGVIITIAKELAPSLQQLCAYGGRQQRSNGNGQDEHNAQEPPLKWKERSKSTSMVLQWITWVLSWPVRRKHSFICFYLTALTLMATRESLWWYWDHGALWCTIHCVCRLLECLFVHEFRSAKDGDVVSLFATVSGCSFYVALMLTFSDPMHRVCFAWWEHLLLAEVQYLQIQHHNILGALRREKEQRNRSYRFPTGVAGFKYVQEPHYMLETCFYFLIGFSSIVAAAKESAETPIPWCHLWPFVFTLVNLSLTARQRHKFWKTMTKEVLPRWKIIPFVY